MKAPEQKDLEKKFKAFNAVRETGLTNMYDVREVIRLAKSLQGVTLTRDDVTYIFGSYATLIKQFS